MSVRGAQVKLLLLLFAAMPVAGSALAQSGVSPAHAVSRNTGPWNLKQLFQVPKATWGSPSGLLREVYYENVPWQGKPTRVFAYYGRPAEGTGPFPAMLLVHGGGGTAFPAWAELWAKRGYAALAMDLSGRGPERKRLPDGGPDQSYERKFASFTEDDAEKMWTYHAVAAVLRGHSLLASLPEVDPQRIGVTGISWGGYLTCIVAGVDPRIKVAVPVYGCGFLDENSCWLNIFNKMSPEQRSRWVEYFDPSQYLPGATCPMLFINGTNDFAYPLDSYQKSYRLVPGPVTLRIEVEMKHSHPHGWAPKEIGLFVDSVLRNGTPLPAIEPMHTEGNRVWARFRSQTPIKEAQLHYTTDTGPWQKRKWHSIQAQLAGDRVEATLPEEAHLVYYLSITDRRGAMVTTPHAERAK